MTANGRGLHCPHCGARLQAFELPDDTGWDADVQFACFNDDCSYYREGWSWMWDNYRIKASYRYRVVTPEKGTTSPLGVWSETALRDRIVADDVCDTGIEQTPAQSRPPGDHTE